MRREIPRSRLFFLFAGLCFAFMALKRACYAVSDFAPQYDAAQYVLLYLTDRLTLALFYALTAAGLFSRRSGLGILGSAGMLLIVLADFSLNFSNAWLWVYLFYFLACLFLLFTFVFKKHGLLFGILSAAAVLAGILRLELGIRRLSSLPRILYELSCAELAPMFPGSLLTGLAMHSQSRRS